MALSKEEFQRAALRLKCEIPAVKAVAEVESGKYGAFLPTGEPVILFERHKFSKLTGRKYDQTYPDISNRCAGGYGPVSTQHARLQKAVALDRNAALQSCSWGLFQVLGMNWEALGYASLQQFVNAMFRSEADHLDSFIRFVETNGLAKYLRSRNWAAFANGYNGSGYKINKYDTKLAAAYKKHGGKKP